MHMNPQRQEEYRRAYQAWQEQLQALHRILLEGEAMEAPKLKGLLNREALACTWTRSGRRSIAGPQDDPFASVG